MFKGIIHQIIVGARSSMGSPTPSLRKRRGAGGLLHPLFLKKERGRGGEFVIQIQKHKLYPNIGKS
jgi:hypothetical protein